MIYNNNMPLTCQFSRFADDVKLCKTIPQFTDSALPQHYLDDLHVWSLETHLNFSTYKCVFPLALIVSMTLFTLLILNIYHN